MGVAAFQNIKKDVDMKNLSSFPVVRHSGWRNAPHVLQAALTKSHAHRSQ